MYGKSPRSKKRKRTRSYTRTSDSFEVLRGAFASNRNWREEDDKDGYAQTASEIEDSKADVEVEFSAVGDAEGLVDNSSGDSESSYEDDSEYEPDDDSEESELETDIESVSVPDVGESENQGSGLSDFDVVEEVQATDSAIRQASKASNSKRIRNNIMKEWGNERSSYLEEFIRHEAYAGLEPKCPTCDTEKVENSSYTAVKCDDCVGYTPRCKSCVIKDHRNNPLHRIKIYNGFFWEKKCLRDIGFIMEMTHDGLPCPEPDDPTEVSVLDIHGIQTVSIALCGCVKRYDKGGSARNQYLRHAMYPATMKAPKTVATFRVLKLFHHMTLQSKISAYDFYHTLARITDITGSPPQKRYDEFVRIVRQYQNIQMLKRAGKGLDIEGIATTTSGDLALECPACPHPGKNLPENWEKDDENGWKYALFLMVDANFRLKSKANRAKDDQELGPGWSYFVEDNKYKEHLKKHVEEKDIRYCDSGLRAVDHANLRGSTAYDASGVVAVQCRHMMVRKNGLGDLQKGEKFVNVDYVLLSSVKAVKIRKIVLSYDINCQYSRNFAKRLDRYDESLSGSMKDIEVVSVIPKFHLPGHGEDCQFNYSLNYHQHVGRTDGENIERGWAYINPVSMSTKEMGKGSRHDTLDDHLHNLNWEREIAFGRILKSKMREATKEVDRHSKAHEEFSVAFPPETLIMLKKRISAWESDRKNNKDPYRDIRTKTSLNEVKRLLAEEEAKEKGMHSEGQEELTAARWLAIGIELQENQHILREMIENVKVLTRKNNSQRTLTQEKNTLLLLQIKAWLDSQKQFMPGLKNEEINDINILTDDWEWTTTKGLGARLGSIPQAHLIDIVLPSSLDKRVRERVCVPGLIEKEIELRKAQAEDALYDVRRILRKGFTLVNKKGKHVRGAGQRGNTRMSDSINKLRGKRDTIGNRYKKARNALQSLDPDGKWSVRLKRLKKRDLVPPGGDPYGSDSESDSDSETGTDKEVNVVAASTGTGQGRYISSWIWRMEGAASDRVSESQEAGTQEVDEGLCVEWARSYARLERWKEEIILLKEEMRRVITYLRWKSDDWLQKGAPYAGHADEELYSNGKVAYANRQANIMLKIAILFEKEWKEYVTVTFDHHRDGHAGNDDYYE